MNLAGPSFRPYLVAAHLYEAKQSKQNRTLNVAVPLGQVLKKVVYCWINTQPSGMDNTIDVEQFTITLNDLFTRNLFGFQLQSPFL